MGRVVDMLAGLSFGGSLLLKLTVVLGVGWLLHGLLHRANPSWRVLLWRTVVFGALLLPFLAPLRYFQVVVASPEASMASLPSDGFEATPQGAPSVEPIFDGSEPFSTAETSPPPNQYHASGVTLTSIAWLVWLAVALFLALRVLLASLSVRRGIRASLVAPDHLQQVLSRVAVSLGCTEGASLRYSREVTSPYLARQRGAVIVIPESMTHPGYAKELPVVLAHEVAHLRGGDLFWGVAMRWFSCLLWFHPLAWRLRNAHSAACEEVCDAAAAMYLGDAMAYSRILARIALNVKDKPSLVVGIPMARSCKLTSRLERVRSRLHSPLTRRSVVAALSIALASLVSFSGLGLVYGEVSGAGPWQARVLHFPTDRTMGTVMIEVDRNPNWYATAQEKGQREWTYFADARGDVPVPGGTRVSLTVSRDAARDLSPLEAFRANDLQRLAFGHVPEGETRPGDACMLHIAHLTGLEMLDLRMTDVGLTGLRVIAGLDALRELALPLSIPGSALSCLAEFESLESIELYSPRVTDRDLMHLASVKTLEQLKLKCGEGMDGYGLVSLVELPLLQDLSLWGGDRPLNQAALKHVGQIRSLKALRLGGSLPVTNAGLAHLSDLTELQDLRLRGNPITDAGLVHLKDMTQLRRLTLDKTDVTDAGLAYLLPKLPRLETLSLPSEITDEGLAHAARCPRLKHLWAGSRGNNPITDAGLAHLAGCRTLEGLQIGAKAVTDAGLASLAELSNLRQLTLFYGSPEISDAGLARLNVLQKLTLLDLPRETAMTTAGLSRLDLPELTNLQAGGLNVAGAPLDLSQMRNLEILTLPNVRDEDLATVRSLPKLRWLQLNWIDTISDAGMAHLAGLTKLERLTIGGPNTTDAGLAYLADMHRLDFLRISGTFTDEGLRCLEGMKALRYLDFNKAETRFSPAGLQHLRDALPLLYTIHIDTPSMARGAGGRGRRSSR